jgi:hypothetical protein
MIDTTTQKPLYVSTDGNAGPYVVVPVDLLEKVKALLDSQGIVYWVDEEAIRLDQEPEVAVVNFAHGTDSAAVQRLLDSRS